MADHVAPDGKVVINLAMKLGCRWRADADPGALGRLNADGSVTELPAGTAGSSAGRLSRPVMSALRETRSRFAVGRSSTPLRANAASTHVMRGTVFTFRVDQAATVRIAIQRTVRGGRRTIATLNRTARPALNRVAFSGRIRRRALQPGRYRAVFTASDAAAASAPRTLRFRIVKG